jgi:hypothetical protein
LIPDLNMIVLLSSAMLFGAALRGFGSRMSMAWGNSPAPVKTDLRAAVAQQRALPKLRNMLDAQIAEYVVAEIRSSDESEYPMLAEDLDKLILQWCDKHAIRRPSPSTIREIIKTTQGVTKKRVWLNMRDYRHQFVRSRQAILGNETPRPVLYFFAPIDTATDTPTATVKAKQTRARTESNACLSRARPDQTRDRTGVPTRQISSPEARPEPRRIAA